jgi:hypothetical protein
MDFYLPFRKFGSGANLNQKIYVLLTVSWLIDFRGPMGKTSRRPGKTSLEP